MVTYRNQGKLNLPNFFNSQQRYLCSQQFAWRNMEQMLVLFSPPAIWIGIEAKMRQQEIYVLDLHSVKSKKRNLYEILPYGSESRRRCVSKIEKNFPLPAGDRRELEWRAKSGRRGAISRCPNHRWTNRAGYTNHHRPQLRPR